MHHVERTLQRRVGEGDPLLAGDVARPACAGRARCPIRLRPGVRCQLQQAARRALVLQPVGLAHGRLHNGQPGVGGEDFPHRQPLPVQAGGADGELERAATGDAAVGATPAGVEVAAVVGVYHVGHAPVVAGTVSPRVPTDPVLLVHIEQRGEATARLVVMVRAVLRHQLEGLKAVHVSDCRGGDVVGNLGWSECVADHVEVDVIVARAVGRGRASEHDHQRARGVVHGVVVAGAIKLEGHFVVDDVALLDLDHPDRIGVEAATLAHLRQQFGEVNGYLGHLVVAGVADGVHGDGHAVAPQGVPPRIGCRHALGGAQPN